MYFAAQSQPSDAVPVNPEEPGEYEWIRYGSFDKRIVHGKWMVFKNFDQLNNAWQKIIHAKQEGELEGCIYLKTSTKVYRPGSYGPGPCTTGVIEVYTTVDEMIEVGEKLCLIVEHDIQFKTEKATKDNIYAGNKWDKKVTAAIMVYNDGKPRTSDRWTNLGYDRKRADIWHLNVVQSPHYSEGEREHGKWVVPITKKEATGVWHILRREIEKGNGVMRMECPKGDKEFFDFHIYATKENKNRVGDRLLLKLERDLTFEFKDKPGKFLLEWQK